MTRWLVKLVLNAAAVVVVVLLSWAVWNWVDARFEDAGALGDELIERLAPED